MPSIRIEAEHIEIVFDVALVVAMAAIESLSGNAWDSFMINASPDEMICKIMQCKRNDMRAIGLSNEGALGA